MPPTIFTAFRQGVNESGWNTGVNELGNREREYSLFLTYFGTSAGFFGIPGERETVVGSLEILTRWEWLHTK